MSGQKAFIANNKYMTKEFLPFGVGVVAAFDEEVAMQDSFRIKELDVKNEWWEIMIPEMDTFLNLDLLVEHNSEKVKNCLYSQDSLTMLFYDEIQEFNKILDETVKAKSDDESQYERIAKDEIKAFFDSKKQELKKFMTVDSLIQFINEKAGNGGMIVASSFLFMQGINGIIYESNGSQRILIFDAKRTIETVQLKSQLIKDSKFSA